MLYSNQKEKTPMKKCLVILLTCLNSYLISYLPAWHFAGKNLLLPLLFIGLTLLYFVWALVLAIFSKKRSELLLFSLGLVVTILGPPLLFLLVFYFQGYF